MRYEILRNGEVIVTGLTRRWAKQLVLAVDPYGLTFRVMGSGG